jgi:DNA-binding transcriptional LysR family regulator
MTALGRRLGQFVRNYPDIVLDVTTDDSHVDLVAAGFDAGIQFGEFIAQDMIAVRVSPDHRPAIVGSPGYFESHPRPESPHDLLSHRCINFRHGSEGVYRWEFDKDDQSLAVSVNGPLILDDLDLVIRAAIDGAGLAFMAEDRARRTSQAERSSACSTIGARLPRLLPLLPESAPAARGAVGADRHTAYVAVLTLARSSR